jgi:hypothetical protein
MKAFIINPKQLISATFLNSKISIFETSNNIKLTIYT